MAAILGLLAATAPASAYTITLNQWTHAPMEGSLAYVPGDVLKAGLDFHTVNNVGVPTTFEFDNTVLYLPYSCTGSNGDYSGKLALVMGDLGPYTLPANGSTPWYPADPALQATWTVPSPGPCAGTPGNPTGTMYNTDKGDPALDDPSMPGTKQIKNLSFVTDIVQDDPTVAQGQYGNNVAIRWHYGRFNSTDAQDRNPSWSDTKTFPSDPGPGDLVPEAPLAILLPLGGGALIAAAVYISYRRARREQSVVPRT